MFDPMLVFLAAVLYGDPIVLPGQTCPLGFVEQYEPDECPAQPPPAFVEVYDPATGKTEMRQTISSNFATPAIACGKFVCVRRANSRPMPMFIDRDGAVVAGGTADALKR